MSRFNRFLRRASRLLAISTVGALLVVAGIALSLPGVPGPGLLLVIAGLAVLAKEFEWAQRLMSKARARAEQVRDRALGRDEAPDPERSADNAPREDDQPRRPQRHEPAA